MLISKWMTHVMHQWPSWLFLPWFPLIWGGGGETRVVCSSTGKSTAFINTTHPPPPIDRQRDCHSSSLYLVLASIFSHDLCPISSAPNSTPRIFTPSWGTENPRNNRSLSLPRMRQVLLLTLDFVAFFPLVLSSFLSQEGQWERLPFEKLKHPLSGDHRKTVQVLFQIIHCLATSLPGWKSFCFGIQHIMQGACIWIRDFQVNVPSFLWIVWWGEFLLTTFSILI